MEIFSGLWFSQFSGAFQGVLGMTALCIVAVFYLQEKKHLLTYMLFLELLSLIAVSGMSLLMMKLLMPSSALLLLFCVSVSEAVLALSALTGLTRSSGSEFSQEMGTF